MNKKGDFKLYNLEINKPVNIKSDDKIDGERKKRLFLKNSYIVEYKGIFNQIEIMEEDKVFYKQNTKFKRDKRN